MYKGVLHTHHLVVTLFLIIYVVKTILLLSNRNDLLARFGKFIKIPEMIVSTLFLISGVFLATQLPFGGKYDYLFFIKIAMVLCAIPLAIIGFKKSNKILAALSLLLITGSYGLAEVYGKRKAIPKDKETTAIIDNSAHDGMALFEANCKLCHGSDGKLGIVGAKDLTATKMDVKAIKEIILSGKGAMPAAAVDEEQAALIAAYVEGTLKAH